MKLYIADLADYNAGHLRGFWLDLEGLDQSDALEEIGAFLKARSEETGEPHEEWAIHDTEDAPELGEYDLHGYCAVQALQDELGEDEARAALAYAEHIGSEDLDKLAESFRDAFNGTWDSEEDFAQNLFDDLGYLADDNPLANYVDWEAVARDLFIGDYFTAPAPGGKLYVFRGI